MWRRRGSVNSSNNNASDQTRLSLNALPSFGRRHSIFSNDPRVERPLIFTIDVPSSGPLGLDLQARLIEKDKPQRGAVIRGFRTVDGNKKGYIELTGRVKIGDVLRTMNRSQLLDLPFEDIIQYAIQLQKNPKVWPLRLEFQRDPSNATANPQHEWSQSVVKPRLSSIFGLNPAQDTNFNDKLQYFRDFFSNRIPTNANGLKIAEKPPMPKVETVNEMYRNLLIKRKVPDDVTEELVRIEPVENKWHIVWNAQQHDDQRDKARNYDAEAAKMAEQLVELKLDSKGIKTFEQLANKLSVNATEWAESFLDHFGLDYLTMKLPEPSPYPIEMMKADKSVEFFKKLLTILRSLTHFTAGIESLMNVPGLVKKVALCFHTEDGDLKKQTLQLLGIICYNSAIGHETVIESFDYYKEVKGEVVRFSCLRDALRSTRYSLAFKEDVLSFINIIVNKAIRLEDRLAIRGDFMALKMGCYFDEIRTKSLAMQRQNLPDRTSVVESPAQDMSKSGRQSQFSTPKLAPSPLPPSARRSAKGSACALVSPNVHTPPITASGSSQGQELDAARSGACTPREEDEDEEEELYASSINSGSYDRIRSQLDNMEKQIEVFETFMEDDRKDTIYQTTDLASIQSVFNRLTQIISQDTDLHQCFLSILQQLLFIPGDRAIGKEMWALSDKILRQIVLLSPAEEVEEYKLSYDDRKTILKMRDHYTAILQKFADENPSSQYDFGSYSLLNDKELNPDEEDEDEMSTMPSEEDSGNENSPKKGRISETSDTSENTLQVARSHSKYAKYFKLLELGMPLQQVCQKAEIDGVNTDILSTPDVFVNEIGDIVSGGDMVKVLRVRDHEKYAKFCKLLQLGMPLEHVKLKAQAEGLNATLLETPDAIFTSDMEFSATVESDDKNTDKKDSMQVCQHEKYAKYFKLLKLGMPTEQAVLKANADGLTGELLNHPDALVDSAGNALDTSLITPKLTPIPAKNHEKYAKYFKLKKMGMSFEHIKLKMVAEGIANTDIITTPDALVDENGNALEQATKKACHRAKEHPSYAKYFKLEKMGMPREQIELKMKAEGLDVRYLDTPDGVVSASSAPVIKPQLASAKSDIDASKPKLRNLYWETLSNHVTTGTIWERVCSPKNEQNSTEKPSQNKKETAANDGDLSPFVDRLTTLFVSQPPPKKLTAIARKPSARRRPPTRIALIDVKRANNIGIMLARFRLGYSEIREAILKVDTSVLYIERVSALLQFAPEPSEWSAVAEYKGDPRLLGDAEQYFYQVLCVPRLTTRLQAIHATLHFDICAEDQRQILQTICQACDELAACDDLAQILRIVLSLGNCLNDGTARGGARAFRLDTLLKLNQVKAIDNSITLLNYLANILRTKDASIIYFDHQISSLEAASRITMQMLKAGDSALRKAFEMITTELDAHAKLEDIPEIDRFQQEIGPFAQRAKRISQELSQQFEQAMKKMDETVRFFGEDPSATDCGPDSFFSIFSSFAKLLQTADRDNERKRIAEERRIRREEATRKRLEEIERRKQAKSGMTENCIEKEEHNFVSLKEGDVEDIVKKIRQKRAEEKRQERVPKNLDSMSSVTASELQERLKILTATDRDMIAKTVSA